MSHGRPSILEEFPRDETSALVRRMPRYARLAWALARDKRLSRGRRAAVLATAAYVVSPIDIVPGIIPVIGQLDDIAVALAGIRLALNGLSPKVRAEALANAGLREEDIVNDLKTTGAVTAWLARSGVRVTGKVAHTAVRGGKAVTQRATQIAERATEAIRRRRS